MKRGLGGEGLPTFHWAESGAAPSVLLAISKTTVEKTKVAMLCRYDHKQGLSSELLCQSPVVSSAEGYTKPIPQLSLRDAGLSGMLFE